MTIRGDKGAEFIGNRIAAWRKGLAYKCGILCEQRRTDWESGLRDFAESATVSLYMYGPFELKKAMRLERV